MKKWIAATATIIAILIIAACICRASFTHYDTLEHFDVALLNDDMLGIVRSSVTGMTGRSSNIVRVRCTSEVKLADKVSMQSAEVVHVFKGDDIKEGEEILILPFNSWIFGDDKSINMGFVNAMMPGDEYLAFLNDAYKVIDKDYVIYETTEALMSPIFSYKDHENVIPDIQDIGEGSYVEYGLVENNEFFVGSEKVNDELKMLKDEIMRKYSGGM